MDTKINRNIAIIGAGNQALAWAQNLQDSKVEFQIGLRANSPSWSLKSKFDVFELGPKLQNFKIIILLIPDDQHFDFVQENISFIDQASIILAHGYSYPKISKTFSNLKLSLIAPKAIASEVRNFYLKSKKVPCVFDSSFNDELRNLCLKLGFSPTEQVSFTEEVQADLFSEQTLLCGVIPYLINECFETLIENGVSEKLAFLETFYESKLIVDTIFKLGPKEFFKCISPNALIGSEHGRSILMDKEFKNKLDNIFQIIKSGDFDKKINSINFQEERDKVQSFWNNTKLQNIFNQLKKEEIL